jgi:predicted dehydrogenase
MSADTPDTDTYALRTGAVPEVAAPDVRYQPPMPRSYRPAIGLIGAGGIAASHLDAYRAAGWDVAAICNRTLAKAEAKAAEYYPSARVTADPADIFNDDTIEVVDITPHPAERVALIEAALQAGKHVLSQKPFVLDLDTGIRLADLAEAKGLTLAVNQNGRWAPHLSWMREAVRAGLIGDVISVHVAIHWDHGWIAGTPFEQVEDLILYDFGIHWFDFLASIVGARVKSVTATRSHARGQTAMVPLLAQALVQLEGGQASLVFDGSIPHGPRDTTYIAGTKGSLRSDGPDLSAQTVTLTTAAGVARPDLSGTWFNDGFRGAMGELLSAIEDGRRPLHDARGNLDSLALGFAAIASAREGRKVRLGEVRALPQ